MTRRGWGGEGGIQVQRLIVVAGQLHRVFDNYLFYGQSWEVQGRLGLKGHVNVWVLRRGSSASAREALVRDGERGA